MKVLVIGSGGREHALVWCFEREYPDVDHIIGLPGNAGISRAAEICDSVSPDDIEGIAAWAEQNEVDLTVVGPEQPLVDGIVDAFHVRGLRVFGPNRKAAQLEGSKVFAKELMAKYGIPTADFHVFEDEQNALAHLAWAEYPLVVKADGLAAGKGVTVAGNRGEAEAAVRGCFSERRFGSAGDRVLIEECLEGYEVSMLAIVDGQHMAPLVPAQDYKRVFDGNQGPNTGGMGCYSPVPAFSDELMELCRKRILQATVDALADEGIIYRGVLYAGLMITRDGPKVLEFNCRFGDPETQVILPRLKTSLFQIMQATTEGRLDEIDIQWSDECCVNVVLASGGYPGHYRTGLPIHGLDVAAEVQHTMVFHAGTSWTDGQVVTSGGRVLNVAALGSTFAEARSRVYDAVGRIHFEGMHYRKDIAAEPASNQAAIVS